MNTNDYRNFLISSIPSARSASGGSEVLCRCFYCNDSDNPENAHFYISIPQNDQTPSMYKCMKCPAKGIVTHRTLLEWNIYDDQIAAELIVHNRNISPYIKHQMKGTYRAPIMNTITEENANTELKLAYFNRRIGTNYSLEDLRNLKVVLNLGDLFKSNKYIITKFTRNENIVKQLHSSFLGFLSIDNTVLNMRRICKEGIVYKGIDKRYINYDLGFDVMNQHRFYTVPTAVNLNSRERIKLHITEGPFDILSIYENLRKREPGIYSCSAGSNYYGTILYFIETYQLPFLEVHVYPDNDAQGSSRKMNYIARQLKRLRMPLYVHRNLHPGEKDFGVPLERIKDTIIDQI